MNYFYIVLLCLLSGSCSNDAINDFETVFTKGLIAPVDSISGVTVIPSLEEFYLFLNERVNLGSLKNNYLLTYSELALKADINTVSKIGFIDFVAYEGCSD